MRIEKRISIEKALKARVKAVMKMEPRQNKNTSRRNSSHNHMSHHSPPTLK
jgi:hypothetical protein